MVSGKDAPVEARRILVQASASSSKELESSSAEPAELRKKAVDELILLHQTSMSWHAGHENAKDAELSAALVKRCEGCGSAAEMNAVLKAESIRWAGRFAGDVRFRTAELVKARPDLFCSTPMSESSVGKSLLRCAVASKSGSSNSSCGGAQSLIAASSAGENFIGAVRPSREEISEGSMILFDIAACAC